MVQVQRYWLYFSTLLYCTVLTRGVRGIGFCTTILHYYRHIRKERNAHDILEAGNKKQKEGKNKTLSVLGNLNTSEYSGERNPTEGVVFPAVSFQDITAVTNNFDRSFIIGQGGFGKVYKVLIYFINFHPAKL
jgi:hypothetical protein